MREQELQEKANKLFPDSYVENAWQRKQDWINGAQWMEENSEVPDLQEEIRELKDKISDIEYDHDDEIDKLQNIIKDQEKEIAELQEQVNNQ